MRNRAENQITFVLIRHGATVSNREHRYLGHTDEGLDEPGKTELLNDKSEGRYPDIDILLVSPMKRCIETAEILYPDVSRIVVPNWIEMDFGEFEGKNYKELNGDPRYQAWIDSNGTHPFPGGESREAFINRVVFAFESIKNDAEFCMKISRLASEKPPVVGCVVHGGTIMALLSHYLGGEYFDYQLPNGGIYMWISP